MRRSLTPLFLIAAIVTPSLVGCPGSHACNPPSVRFGEYCAVPCSSIPNQYCYADGAGPIADAFIDVRDDGPSTDEADGSDVSSDLGADTIDASDASDAVGAHDALVFDVPPCEGTSCHDIVQFAVGTNFTCVRLRDQSVWCWGANDVGQLGTPASSADAMPTQVPGLVGVVDLAAGPADACAVLNDGSMRCWGDNSSGQLGTGTTTPVSGPTPVVTVSTAVQVAVGGYHACARLMDGSARCWGANFTGQLGDGTVADHRVAVAVSALATGVVQVIAGQEHSCARLADGTAQCWGSNAGGRLGDGTAMSQRLTPVPVAGLARVAELAAGSAHTCARTTDGAVLCWGANFRGQVGDGSMTDRPMATLVTLPGLIASRIAASGATSGAVFADGNMECWGANDTAQCGDGSRLDHSAPTPGAGHLSVAIAGLGSTHGCAVATDGVAVCWGANMNGELGDGSRASRTDPGPVTF